MNPSVTFALLAFVSVGAIFGVGFVAGYKGSMKHSYVAVSSMLAVFMIPQAANLFFLPAPKKAISGDLALALIVSFGSLVGALRAKKMTVGRVFAFHAGLVAVSSGAVFIFGALAAR